MTTLKTHCFWKHIKNDPKNGPNFDTLFCTPIMPVYMQNSKLFFTQKILHTKKHKSNLHWNRHVISIFPKNTCFYTYWRQLTVTPKKWPPKKHPFWPKVQNGYPLRLYVKFTKKHQKNVFYKKRPKNRTKNSICFTSFRVFCKFCPK